MEKEEDKNPGGRPTKFKKEFIELARNYCLLGAVDEDLATFFNVSIKTIEHWKATKKKFLGAIKGSKFKADSKVAASLYKRANGYWGVSESEFKSLPIIEKTINPETGTVTEKTTGYEMVEVRRVEKALAPETKAIELFLTNRTRTYPEHLQWKKAQKIEVTGKDGKDLMPQQAIFDERAKKTREEMLALLAKEDNDKPD